MGDGLWEVHTRHGYLRLCQEWIEGVDARGFIDRMAHKGRKQARGWVGTTEPLVPGQVIELAEYFPNVTGRAFVAYEVPHAPPWKYHYRVKSTGRVAHTAT